MTLAFGTDGVRGLANRDLTPEYVSALGRAAAAILGDGAWVIGRDTRRSGPLLQAALAAGLAAEGAEVMTLGVLPTPAAAHHSEVHGCPAAMISASHNSFGDNGVKFFAAGGLKLDDDTQRQIEIRLEGLLAGRPSDRLAPIDGKVGTIESFDDALVEYADHVEADGMGGRRLDGMRVVIDAANGAASAVAPKVLQRLGASVTVMHASPDGVNINADCGSTHPEDLARTVHKRRAQLGLAFDGDADRLVAIDEKGAVVDGDSLLAMFAIDRKERGMLRGDTIVATVLSNGGLRRSLAAHDISVVTCGVGDRNVLAALEEGGWSLGGEQSGHVIFRDLATTGDGLLAGVQLLDLLARSGRPLSELAVAVDRFPQALRNVRFDASSTDLIGLLAADIALAESALGDDGRVLVRLSGTEPLVRIMVEATSDDDATTLADALVAAVERVAPVM